MLTMGTIMHGVELDDRCKNKTGHDLIRAKLEAMNYNYCWCGTPKQKALWGIVNRLLWRFKVMFEGDGDCELADIDRTPEQPSQPHDKLWTLGRGLSKNNHGRWIRANNNF